MINNYMIICIYPFKMLVACMEYFFINFWFELLVDPHFDLLTLDPPPQSVHYLKDTKFEAESMQRASGTSLKN